MSFDFPFVYRLIFLLCLLSLIAYFDWLKNRAAARKWQEYLFVVGVGLIGVSFAIIVDTITSRISPEYFIYGKGIPLAGFHLGVAAFAVEVGFSAGIVIGGAYLVANNAGRGRNGLSYTELLRLLWVPATGAILLAPVMSWFCRKFDPTHLREEINFIRPEDAGERFIIVWGIHAGLYIGAIFGVVVGALMIRHRMRKVTAATPAE